jgi:short-subunit dehydrogenase
VTDHEDADLRRLVDVNVTGALHGASAALERFRQQGSGVLVLVSSLLGLVPNPQLPAYVASRFATRGLALSLRQAVAGDPDIEVCLLLPGPTDTPIFARAANRTGRTLRAIPPTAAPERVAAAIVGLTRRPRRQVTVGASGRAMLLAHRVWPRATEWAVARWSASLLTTAEPASGTDGALHTTDRRASTHGGWRRGRIRSWAGGWWGRVLARPRPGAARDRR